MRTTVFGCLGVAAVAFALQFTSANVRAADWFSACNPCDEVACDPCGETIFCDPCDPVCGPKVKAGKWFLNGHLEAGFFANGHGAKSTYTFPGVRGADYWSGNGPLLMNTRLTGAQVNQVYVSMGKSVDGRRGLDIGGTVDFTWGTDAWIVQSAGLEFNTGRRGLSEVDLQAGRGRWGSGDYFASVAQAYVEAAYGDLNIIAGKFYAPFGTSHYKSTDNFFYTWAPTAMIAPHVGGGAYASYKVNSKFSVTAGWVMPDEIGESSKNNAVLGGFNWAPSKRFNLFYAFAAGRNSYHGYALNDPGGGNTDLFVHSLVATVQFNPKLKNVFEWTLLNVNPNFGGPGREYWTAYGFNNELIYQANKRWAFGTRFGMVNSDFVLPIGTLGPGDLYTVSLGANWTPNQ
ncbi:MAG: porin [Planctomycetaceae bacterium]|nr:porin [Planctomycetaceae bacterium]